jgi:hypothetical protein
VHRDALQADHVYCTLGTTIKKAGSRARFREVDFTYPSAIASKEPIGTTVVASRDIEDCAGASA